MRWGDGLSRVYKAHGGTVSRALLTSLAGDTHCIIKRRRVWGELRDARDDLPPCSFHCTPEPGSMSFDDEP